MPAPEPDLSAAGAAPSPPAASIRRVLVLADRTRPRVGETLDEVAAWLAPRVDELVCEREARGLERLSPDLVVVLGGDGAILGAARAFAAAPVPTLGIHFGRVGFLASATASRWRDVLEGVLAGRGIVEERMRLEARREQAGREDVWVALNEVVVQRGAHQGMLTASLWLGEQWVTSYRADGLIVATPSGSTAYSLAAGGPILAPSLSALVVTPVASQGLSSRPIVLHADSPLTVRVERASGISTVVVDGQAFAGLEQGGTVTVNRHPVPYPLLSMPGLDPYRRLRSRLGWGAGGAVEVFPSEGRPEPPDVDGGDGHEL